MSSKSMSSKRATATGEAIGRAIATGVGAALERTAWIRRMFEEGDRLRAEFGAENVSDLSLGNPILDPPPEAQARLEKLCREREPGVHRYTHNAGRIATREAIAEHLERATKLPYRADHVVMTVGAGGALNITLRAILDPEDEVLVLAPYFVDYAGYVANHGGRLVPVPTDAHFQPDPDRVADAITPRTRALIINSPNNPTGVTYTDTCLRAVADVLERAALRNGRPIYLVSDEPYRAIVYDGVQVPWPATFYRDTIHITSFSKDLSLAGERIGYVAVSPRTEAAARLFDALVFATRVLGFVNAPVLLQRWIEGLLGVNVDYSRYARSRELLLRALEAAGYEFVRPTGAFYVFPRVPRQDRDDIAFTQSCLQERLLVVPGTGFGCPGHIRLSYAVPDRDLELAANALARLV